MSRFNRLKLINITKNDDDRYYNQYIQESSIRFTLCKRDSDNNFMEQFKPVTCREIWSDAISHGLLGVASPEMYGFYTDSPINVDEYALSIYMDSDVVEAFIHNIRIMDKFFNKQGLEKCKIYRTTLSTPDKVNLLILFDRFWITSPVLASLHSLFFRACSYDMTASTFRALIIKLIKVDNVDTIFLEKVITTLGLNKLVFILKEITKENPVTGVNDEYIIPKLQSYYISNMFSEHVAIRLPHLHCRSYSLSDAHSYHGIYSILCAYERTKNDSSTIYTIGRVWVYALKDLLTSSDFVYKTIKI